MKRICVFLMIGVILLIKQGYSQAPTVFLEDFDKSTINLTVRSDISPWQVNSNYFVSFPNSFLAEVPNKVGDSVIFETQIFDFTQYNYLQLRFNQICKISPKDIALVQYRTYMAGIPSAWERIEPADYQGRALFKV